LSTHIAMRPPFSWATTPVYQMFADYVQFKDEDVRTIAETTDFLCVEKKHGLHDLGSADAGAKHAIAQFKALKPDMTCLVYLNSAFAYPFIQRAKVFDNKGAIHEPENARYKAFLLTDPETGELAYREGDHVHYFDVLNPEFRAWWVDAVAEFVRDSGGNGLFVDQMHGFSWLREERKDDVADAQALMMRMAKEAMGPDKMLLLNNAAHIPELFEAGDAFMFEHYQPHLLSKEGIVSDWALMKQIADAGKISVWRIGVEQDQAAVARRESGQKLTNEYLASLSRERIAYYLAAFLIGAQENSYLQYGWGWDLCTGPLCPQPELQRPLGKPLGEAVRKSPESWVFHRQFEHVDVTVDLEAREGHVAFGTGR